MQTWQRNLYTLWIAELVAIAGFTVVLPFLPYYVQEILPAVLQGKRTVVAAHGNSLRALVMVLEKLSPEGILKREIAPGVPIIYRLNADATVASTLDLAA